MDLLESMDARTVHERIEKRFKRREPALRKSITFYQGRENSEHKQLSEYAAIAVYFCHPHSPWEKGTGEDFAIVIQNTSTPNRNINH
jgi:IS30 family transposase